MITIPQRLILQSVLNTYLTNGSVPLPLSVASHSSLVISSLTSEHKCTTTLSPSSNSLGTSLVPQTASGWPVQPYDVNITMVSDAWREWHVGLGDGEVKRDSIMALEMKFGSSWWYEQKIRQWHSRRKKLISMIDQRVAQGYRLEDVIKQLEMTGKSLDCLCKDIEKGINLFKI